MTSVIIYSKVNIARIANHPIIHIFPVVTELDEYIDIYYANYISQTLLQQV